MKDAQHVCAGIIYNCCAAEAVFFYTAENSHHLEASVTSKYPLFKEEKISVRRMARCQVTSEKSSENCISLFGGGLPTRKPLLHIFHMLNGKMRVGCARFTRKNHSPGRGGGRGDLRNGAIR
jgi:hypothetical protein